MSQPKNQQLPMLGGELGREEVVEGEWGCSPHEDAVGDGFGGVGRFFGHVD